MLAERVPVRPAGERPTEKRPCALNVTVKVTELTHPSVYYKLCISRARKIQILSYALYFSLFLKCTYS